MAEQQKYIIVLFSKEAYATSLSTCVSENIMLNGMSIIEEKLYIIYLSKVIRFIEAGNTMVVSSAWEDCYLIIENQNYSSDWWKFLEICFIRLLLMKQ